MRRQRSVARAVALATGITWLALAAAEAAARDALDPVLRYTSAQSALRWGVGAVLVVASFGTEVAARIVMRVIGAAVSGLVVWALLRPTAAGRALGFDGPLPFAAIAVYVVTAVVTLAAGFADRGGTIRP